MHFLQWKYLNVDEYLTEVCFEGWNYQYSGIGSDNGLALTGQQAIMWTNDGLIWWLIYVSLGLGELR